jgi:hypothetical protein
MSFSSSQDSNRSEPEFIDLFGRDQLSNMTQEQYASLNEVPRSLLPIKVNKKKIVQDLSNSDSDDSSSNDKLYNKDYACSVIAKSKYVDNKTDFERFIKLYCMYVGMKGIKIDDQIDTIIKSKHSLIKRSNVKIELKHLRSELNCRYHYIVTIKRERHHSNHSMKILKGYLSCELYRLPKSEIDFVKKELEQFLKEHEDYIEEEEKKQQE